MSKLKLNIKKSSRSKQKNGKGKESKNAISTHRIKPSTPKRSSIKFDK